MPRRTFASTIALVGLLAACGGGPTATQNNGGQATQNNGGQATQPGGGQSTPAPQATQSGGGGGGGANGSAHFEISGGASKSGDLSFLPIASMFGGNTQTLLNFTTNSQDTTETLTLTFAGGAFAAVYSSTDITVTGANCTTANLNLGANSASGSFECPDSTGVSLSGGTLENVLLKGTFDARS